MLQLQGGDIIEALDPVTGKWSPAVIHALARNGLVEVRWKDPGTDANGKPFHPIGEVWAEQIRLKRRPAPALQTAPKQAAAVSQTRPAPRRPRRTQIRTSSPSTDSAPAHW